MAIYHCSVKPISRKSGRSAVAAAAYRAGIELVDQISGVVHNYTRKRGVLSSEIIAPFGRRIGDPSGLWNAAEAAEKRKDARVAREIVIALPEELTAGQRRELATEYAQEIADEFGVAVGVDLHAPDREGDSRNWHAHLLMSTREVHLTDEGYVLGAKSVLEWSDTKRKKWGYDRASDAVEQLRERWAELQNEALEEANCAERVDHRSHRRRDLETLPSIHMGPTANDMERKGKTTDKGDYNRNIQEQNALIVEIEDLKKLLIKEKYPLPELFFTAENAPFTQHAAELYVALVKELDQTKASADFSAKFAVAAAVNQPDFSFPEDSQDDLFAVMAAAERAEFDALAAAKAAQEAEQARLEAMAMMQAEQERAAARAAFEDKARAQLFADREQARLVAEAQTEQERERTRAIFAAKALAAQEAHAAAASREAVVAGGFQLEAITDHLIDHPKDRAGILEMYLNAPVDLTSTDSYTGQQCLKITEYKAEQMALNRRAGPLKTEFEQLQAELKAELGRPALSRAFSSKAKEIEAKIDRNRSFWTKLKEAYEKLASSVTYIVERLGDYEKAETQNVQSQRQLDFEAAERAVPQRIEQRRIEAEEAPERARVELERREALNLQPDAPKPDEHEPPTHRGPR